MLRLRDLREDKDLNEEDIARILNMSQAGYSKYESLTNNIPLTALIKLAIFYNTSLDYLLGETNDINPHTREFSEEVKQLISN